MGVATPGVTPQPPRDEVFLLRAEIARNEAALDLAADIIACQDARIIQLEADQASLILASRRADRRA
jgi:hypothetical protein